MQHNTHKLHVQLYILYTKYTLVTISVVLQHSAYKVNACAKLQEVSPTAASPANPC